MVAKRLEVAAKRYQGPTTANAMKSQQPSSKVAELPPGHAINPNLTLKDFPSQAGPVGLHMFQIQNV